MAKRKIIVGGQEVMGEEVQFQSDNDSGGEKWSVYLLADGTSLKIKPVLADVLRIEGQYAPNGDPLYTVTASLVVASTSPESLRKGSK